jgi:hypothetical protein
MREIQNKLESLKIEINQDQGNEQYLDIVKTDFPGSDRLALALLCHSG